MGGLFGGVQGTGRGGRTGHPCMCVFVTSGTFNPPQTGEDLSCVDHMKKWTKGNICLRLVPSGVMDGKPETCQSLKERYSNTEFCDKCQPGTVIARLILQAIENTPEPRHITCLDGIDDNDNSSLGPMISVVDCAVPSAPASVLSTVSKNRSYEDRRKALTSSKVSKKSQQSSNRSTTSSANSRTTSTPSESSRPWESIPRLCVQCPIVLRLRVRLSMCEVFTISGNRNLVRLSASKLRLGASEGASCIYKVFTIGGIEIWCV
jgi:hypothetical protein